MPKNKVVIFDFDGVIADSMMAAYDTWKEAGASITMEEYRDRHNRNINHAKPLASIDFHEEYQHKIKDINVFDGISEVISELSSSYSLVIVSSTLNIFIEKVLSSNDLLEKFDAILANEVSTSKVEKFRMVFEKYNITSIDCVIITDTLGDMKEAAEVNMPSIGVGWGYQKPLVLRAGTAVSIVNKPSEIVAEVEKLFR